MTAGVDGRPPARPAVRRLRVAERARLAAEIVASYRTVQSRRSATRLPALVDGLRATSPRPRRVLAGPGLDGWRLGQAVTRTLAPLPGGSKCLTRALVMLELLAARGHAAELVIAVLPGESMLDAHAWVEVGEQPLLPPAPGHGRLLVL